ncbi:MAG TPA: hypothetical protein VFE62_12405 [Gemmataceae bacterium]|nr:hypothetical protein [Gemmataceae bacterium]
MKTSRKQAKRVIFWTLLSFVALQLALNVWLEMKRPEVYDPEYRDRLMLLQERVAENPGRPLMLVVGSSRIMTGVSPEMLPPLETVDGAQPLTFNFAHSGAGALHNLVAVHRVLREGFEPRWMVIEVVPHLLPAAQHATMAKLALAGDLPVLHSYIAPAKLYGWYAEERATAVVNHRGAILRELTPFIQHSRWDVMALEPLGWKTPNEPIPDAAERVRRTAVVQANYQSSLQRFQVHETSRQAMRELLELCRSKKISVALLITPESSEFRGWYPAETQAKIAAYCDELRGEFGVPIIDARAWLDDADFSDGHHILPDGAKHFTLRLGADVLNPLATGRLRANVGASRP